MRRFTIAVWETEHQWLAKVVTQDKPTGGTYASEDLYEVLDQAAEQVQSECLSPGYEPLSPITRNELHKQLELDFEQGELSEVGEE